MRGILFSEHSIWSRGQITDRDIVQFDLGGGSTTEKSARVSMASESMASESMVHSMASGALRRAKGKNFVENRGPFSIFSNKNRMF